MKDLCFIFFTSLFYFSVLNLSTPADTLAASQSTVGSDTLVSSGQSFELGLFSTGNSRAWYLGIWYKNFPDIVVWVANRGKPLADSYGAMTLSKNGSLVLLDQMNSTIWSSRTSRKAEDPVAQLLETGNLVVIDKAITSSESYIWQSFDFPSDTLLPGMRLRLNFKTGPSQFLTSWKNASDPSLGLYTYKINHLVLPELVLAQGSKKEFRSGPWNGLRFTGLLISVISAASVLLFLGFSCLCITWQERFNIIMGIARGLLYLHQDSRLRIIHRDLKSSNILLDRELTSKISDFGIARIFGHNQKIVFCTQWIYVS